MRYLNAPWARTTVVFLAALLRCLSAHGQTPPEPTTWTLEGAVAYAQEHNPELLAAAAEVRVAQAEARLAVAAQRVSASLNGYLSTGTFDNMVRSGPGSMPEDMQMMSAGSRGNLGLTVTTPLWTGGWLSARARQAQGLTRASEADLEAMRLELAFQTRVAYRAVLWRERLVEAWQRDVAAHEELLRVDEVKLNAGKVPLYYYLRDKTRLAESRQSLANAQRDYEVAMYDLSVLLGLPSPRALELTDSLGYEPFEPAAEEALRTAAQRRPELAAVRARLESAAEAITAARAEYRPQVAAALMLDAMDADGESSRGGYTAAIVASLPLADGGRRSAQVAAAAARRSQLGYREEQLAQVIGQQVMTAIARLKASDQNVRTAMEAQAAAEEDYRVARLRYDAGKAINLEPLDALAALQRARTNLLQAMFDHSNAVDDLRHATGELGAVNDE